MGWSRARGGNEVILRFGQLLREKAEMRETPPLARATFFYLLFTVKIREASWYLVSLSLFFLVFVSPHTRYQNLRGLCGTGCPKSPHSPVPTRPSQKPHVSTPPLSQRPHCWSFPSQKLERLVSEGRRVAGRKGGVGRRRRRGETGSWSVCRCWIQFSPVVVVGQAIGTFYAWQLRRDISCEERWQKRLCWSCSWVGRGRWRRGRRLCRWAMPRGSRWCRRSSRRGSRWGRGWRRGFQTCQRLQSGTNA